MSFKLGFTAFMLSLILMLSGCVFNSDSSIVNRYAEVLLTKNNELQFRFKINDKILENENMYKVKVSIHNRRLASALGTNEIVYGENSVYSGEFLEAEEGKEQFIFMDPIPLKEDLHIADIEKMVVTDEAVSIEVFSDSGVLGKAYLTNFSSQL